MAGHDDWRIPEVAELLSIVDYERFNPAVGEAFDGAACGLGCDDTAAAECSCTQLGAYWSARGDASSSPVATVSFNLGLVLGHAAAEAAYVRALRGRRPAADQRFVDNGDGTITDRLTRLMWEKKVRVSDDLHDVDRRMYWSYDGERETVWDWIDAVNSEDGVRFAGHDDWRIPNVKELYSLFEPGPAKPGIAAPFARDDCRAIGELACSLTSADIHWTSTTFADFPSLALAVGFGAPGKLEREPPAWVIRVAGGVEPHQKTLSLPTRAVRGPVEIAR